LSTSADREGGGVAASSRVFVLAFTALRIFTGLVWLSNGLAKLTDKATYDWGFISFNLITRGVARSIAEGASAKTPTAALGDFYQHVVLPHWGIFGAFLTVAELAIGLGLVLGIATRLAAVGGLLLIGPIWVMLLHTNLYLWQYPAEDLFPLLLLAIVPAGRLGGLDGRLSRHFGYRWPF